NELNPERINFVTKSPLVIKTWSYLPSEIKRFAAEIAKIPETQAFERIIASFLKPKKCWIVFPNSLKYARLSGKLLSFSSTSIFPFVVEMISPTFSFKGIFEASTTFFKESNIICSNFVKAEASPILLNSFFTFSEEIIEAQNGSGKREESSYFARPDTPFEIFSTTVSLSKPRLLKILLYETKVLLIFYKPIFSFHFAKNSGFVRESSPFSFKKT